LPDIASLSGENSASVEALGKMGDEHAISLDGGWRAWNEAVLPVEKE
jgi:hypothetical protein